VNPPGGGKEAGGTSRVAQQLWVRGVVQGVGFRPFVYNLARRVGIVGWVRNTSAGVQIHAEGTPAEVQAFVAALPQEAPPRSFIASLEASPAEPTGDASFVILESAADPDAYQLVSPDIALCQDCRAELLDEHDRRFHYPFTNCTNCGPRFTIIESLPYDRERTTMRHFPLCPLCRREYEDPTDRRFHAEPNACPVCGPQVWLVERPAETSSAAAAGPVRQPAEPAAADVPSRAEPPDVAIDRAAELLRSGHIVAVKGLGGFHIACDATDGAAVRRLKRRKGRPHKPLAVMFADVAQLRRHCAVSPAEEGLLESPEHPIVLVDWQKLGPRGEPLGELDEVNGADPAGVGSADPATEPRIDPEVAVRQRYLGAMLPYTPLHLLLLQAAGRPLVMTSGNLAEEPIVKSWEETARLRDIPDDYLLHDREIWARYDDSVALVRRGRPRLLRRSRGYAPFPVPLPRALPQVLACGAELKNTFCLTRDANAFLSQHIGDLENIETLEHFEASVELYKRLFRLQPAVIAYDLHPEYLATKYALALPNEGIEARVGVQHHHAHVAACMAEHAHPGPVIGVSMDGLGYGADGALWGGEMLLCDYTGYRRAAHFEYLPLPGGELAIRRPARTAAGWLLTLLGTEALAQARGLGLQIDDAEAEAVRQQLAAGVNAPLTSSCGRLFDAVAALAGLRSAVTYEGQAAIELEMVSSAGAEPYPFQIDGEISGEWAGGGDAPGPPPARILLAPLFEAVLTDLQAGRAPAFVGSRLHAGLAALIVDLCRRLRAAGGPPVVALSGGVFQNRLLTELAEAGLEAAGFTVLTHALVPANDGGLSLGQAVVAGYTQMAAQGG
jgi:hydrogenase maturation protein HypF